MKLHLIKENIPFNLDITLACGQVFRWHKSGDTWTGIVDGKQVHLRQEDSTLIYDGITRTELIKYLDLTADLTGMMLTIRNTIQTRTDGYSDPFFETAAEAGLGLRIIRQDPWECLMSFICSQNSNIPAIRQRIEYLCRNFGDMTDTGDYAFPSPQKLAFAEMEELRQCSTGYRARYLTDTARYIHYHPDFLNIVSKKSYASARTDLMTLPGVGPKVADCVLLFAFHQYQAVPVDVWIRSIITSRYPGVLSDSCNKRNCPYDNIAGFCREYFGDYAGYAQQLIFAARSTK